MLDRPNSWNPPARMLSQNDDTAASNIAASGSFARILNASGLSLALTSYQAGRLYLIGSTDHTNLTLAEEYFQRPMGVTYANDQLWMVTQQHILQLSKAQSTAPFTHHFRPSSITHTGALNGHDLALDAQGRPYVVATAQNEIARLESDGNLRSYWSPHFIGDGMQGDRCHLNGLAMSDDGAAFATAFAATTRAEGWRSRKANGGVVFDVQRNGIITTGLSMPHSPRLYDGRLWLCNSGSGEFGFIDLRNGSFEPVIWCPGFVRGLAIYDGYAFIGLSKPRHARFDGLPIHGRLKLSDQSTWAGIQVVDLYSGETAAWLEFAPPVLEFYDICVLPNIGAANATGPKPNRS